MTETQNDADSVSPLNLSRMTKAQLLDYADENGVDGVTGSMTKAQIISQIEG